MAETIKTMGIVLKSSKHTAEAARLIEIFSPELGRFSAVIRGVEKPKAKLAVAAQPFCFGEFMLSERNGYYTVIDCYVQDSFFSLAYNLDNYVLGSSLLETTSKIAQAGESNLELFTLLLNSLKVMAYENADPTAVTIKFIIETLNLSGFGFDLNNCEVCAKPLSDQSRVGLTYEGGGAVCAAHMDRVNNVGLTSGEWKTLKTIKSSGLEKLATVELGTREDLTSCLSLMLKQFYYRTGDKIQCLIKYF